MTLALAKTLEDLSTSWFRDLLRETGQIDASEDLISSDTQPIGTGQMGYVVRSTLQYSSSPGSWPKSLIIKLASPDSDARNIGLALGIYKAEVGFYREIAAHTTMQLPECLYSDLDESGWLTIVLEDMSEIAKQGDVLVGGSVSQAKRAMTELAKLQAPFWNKVEWLEKPWLAPRSADPLYDLPPKALEPFISRFGHAFSGAQSQIFREAFPKAQRWFDQWRAPFTMTHGDFRLDNVLLPTRAEAPPMTTVDWQTVKMGPPLLDVAYYLGVCLSTSERRAHERELLQLYQQSLAELGVKQSWEAIWEDYRFCAWYGVLLCAFSIQVPQTERGDRMFVQSAIRYADMARDLNILELVP